MKNMGTKIAGFVIAAAWTIFIVVSVIHNNSNHRFTVVHQTETSIKGYENQVGFYNVYTSPALNWERTASFTRTLGWIFIAVMWVAFVIVMADGHLGKKTGDPTLEHKAEKIAWVKGLALIFTPVILSAVSFFANYSSAYDQNFVQVDEGVFTQWVSEGKIEPKGKEGKVYVDATDDKVLLHLFDNKRWIK